MLALTPPAHSLRLPRFIHVIARVLVLAATRTRRLAASWRRRQDALMLARADDHVLADLGLSRSDVVDAFSGPPWEDPTIMLRSRALERRLSRHHLTTGLLPPSVATLPPSRPSRF
jgi:uncharacterized protein YjiS (DUF1127 family)